MRPAGRAERAELDAAGVVDPVLREDYLICRALHAAHGRTYFLATRLLPVERRVHVHALYGFARHADEIVDAPDETASTGRLDAVEADLTRALAGPAPDAHPVVRAVAHTARTYGLAPELFDDFMASMRMDLTVTGYADDAALARYVRGSAEVIGLQMLPVLGTVGPREEAAPYAALLGAAFQVTNFLRDVGEDLDRGRVYLPADELAAFDVDRELLCWCRDRRRTDPRVRRALAHLVARTHATYRRAERGIDLLEPMSRACVDAARRLYEGILDEIADAGYDVLSRRVAVPARRRAAVALPGAARAGLARLRTPSPGRGA
ncbi:phytoene/squalene synthase family protein [Pseudonocardia endophytica]|uniref:Phytoene synthase n=1 Tax=Pseudonocardia endophytica TaxID=401976 RepID=A0A4R1HSA1_PSEEN|nr:phytoene/squalene synthase family protein [Pseudonocardia endophytica]TCK25058.1 phytoene synthase [Pseudonocardia endophytica]